MNVSGSMAIRPPMAPTQEQMQERFTNADVDGSGGLTIEEMAASAPEGADLSKLQEKFAKLDTDGNGEVTTAEHQAAMEKRMEKMEAMSGQQSFGQFNSQSNTLDSLLESLSDSDDLTEQQKAKVNSLLSQLENGPSKSVLDDTFSLLEEVIPSINVMA
ncbi:EF-hand domain-containing protein [Thalassotalea euphylliae]|uniref:EF-hand domain-containing protein n=1 Tax=Thalassotalea euphylliae TaxID=1655234 RepID=UPI00362E637E